MSFNIVNIPSQKGRTAIVTGANVGLGYETTIALSKKHIHVIMACRNIKKAQLAKENIIKINPTASLEIMILDLNSLKSVREFADSFKANHKKLDLLINNAGIMIPPFGKTEDGFESQLGVNHLSHFLLTGLLLPILENTENARIISLSSIAHKSAKINFDNLNSENSYKKMEAYGQSKLACLIFSYELDRKLKKSGSKVKSLAAHPGVSNTDLGRHVPKFLYTILLPLISLFSHSPENAAMPTLYAALGEDLEGGMYIGPTSFNEMKGKPGIVKSTPLSHNREIAQQLWTVSEKLTHINYLT